MAPSPACAGAPLASDLASLAGQAVAHAGLSLPRQALRDAPADAATTFVSVAALCAGGTSRPPRGDRLARLAEALRGETPIIATLAGARIEADAQDIRWLREPGEMARSGLQSLDVQPGEPAVWDGRHEVQADRPLRFEPLAGRAARLSPQARAALLRLPAPARGGLPATEVDGQVICPLLEAVPGVVITSLALDRLRAACGAIPREGG